MKVSKGRIAFNIFNYGLMILLCLTIILPFMNIIAVSLSGRDAILNMEVTLWPKDIQFDAYAEIIGQKVFARSIVNTVGLTIVVTFFNVLVDIMCAYAFSKEFYGKKVLNYFFIVSMYFSGGLIPTYLLMTNYLHLNDTYAALILPGLVSVFYVIVIRTQIQSIPPSLTEAAKIDGATEAQVLFKVIVPSIKPTIAAVGMFVGLGTWNSWFNVMLYAGDERLWTLQYYLRAVVFSKQVAQNSGATAQQMAQLGVTNVVAENFQMAAIVLVALPVVAVYPFVQKYFVKGMLAGSVKE